MGKLYTVAARVFVAVLIAAAAAQADGPDISAQRLLSSWQDEDPSMKMVAEVIASAFASGFSWGGDGDDIRRQPDAHPAARCAFRLVGCRV